MNSEFCMQCGHKVEFTLKAPNFCPSCGTAFNESARASTAAAPAVEEKPEESTERLPAISKLEYSVGESSTKVTFGDLANQAQNSSTPYTKAPARPLPPSDNNEDIQKIIMAECASAREPTEESG